MLVVAEQAPATAESLPELYEILRAAALGEVPRRDTASRYMQCREALLGSKSRASLPGFVVQCGSIYKFFEFIAFYHPDIAARVAFVDTAFSGDRLLPPGGAAYDFFGDPEF